MIHPGALLLLLGLLLKISILWTIGIILVIVGLVLPGLGDARQPGPSRRPGAAAAGHAQPARPHRRGHRNRQDQDAAGDRRAAVGRRRAGRARRRQGRPERAGPAGRDQRPGHRSARRRPATPGRPPATRSSSCPWAASARACRSGDGDRLRAGAAVEGARPQPHAGELARADLPLRRRRRAAAAGPQGPALGGQLADQRRGQAAAQGPRRALVGHRRASSCASSSASRSSAATSSSASRSSSRRHPAHRRRRPRGDQRGRAGRRPGPAGAVLDVPHVAARRAVRGAARGRRPRQAQARLLLRRGAPAVHRGEQGVPGVGDPDGPADPVEGRRHLLRDAEPHRRPQRGARPARQPGAARAADVHPEDAKALRKTVSTFPSPTTTTSRRCSRRWAPARPRSRCSPSAAPPPRSRGRCCGRPAR